MPVFWVISEFGVFTLNLVVLRPTPRGAKIQAVICTECQRHFFFKERPLTKDKISNEDKNAELASTET